jgi:hypothetical protein
MATDRRFERAAVELAARGYYVFPCRPRGSTPLTPNGWKDATRDERTILSWWDRWPDANVAVACGPSGIAVLDIDAKHGADPDEIIPELDLEPHTFVWTGEAPERGGKYPNSLAGARGGHVYFRGELGIVKEVRPGCEIRGTGAYVIAPPSIHSSGVPYLGNLPPVERLKPMPDELRAAADRAKANGGAKARPGDDDEIKQGEGRHEGLIAYAMSRFYARGVTGQPALDAMRAWNKRNCKPPIPDRGTDGERGVLDLWEWCERSSVSQNRPPYPRDYSSPLKSWEGMNSRPAGLRVRWWRESDMRAPRQAWEGRLPIGALASLTADGGMGKGHLAAWIQARLTRGQLPGAHFGTPINCFVIGTDEDGVEDTWIPRVKAAGGDVTRIGSPEIELDQELDLVRDIDLIEEFIREGDFKAGYLDQPLDHFPSDSNSHHQQHVRKVLRPIQRLARKLDLSIWFTCHPSFASAGARGIREGGSVQFGNVVRSALVIGWHPAEKDIRVLARRKGNFGRVPPGIAFRIEDTAVVNPDSGEVIGVGAIADMVEDPDLRWEDLRFTPPTEPGEKTGDVIERVLRELGADGEWRPRKEAENACTSAGVNEKTFANAFSGLGFIETESRGRETWWKLKD